MKRYEGYAQSPKGSEGRNSMNKLLLILNPNAGMKQARKMLPEMLAHFQEAGYLPTVCVTERRGDATDFAERFSGEFDRVVTCGGDGTLNETVTGLIRGRHQTPLGYIPCGTTNDFAAGLGLSHDLMRCCAVAAKGRTQTIDAGLFSGMRYFTYTASFGAFTSASYTAPQNVKNVLGHAAYILEGIRSLSEIRPIHLKIEAGEELFEDDYLFGAVCNSTSLGGILKLDSDEVDMNDGLFETLLIRMPKDILELNRILTSIASKKHDDPMLTFIRAKSFAFSGAPELKWTLDGEEAEGQERVTVENVKDALTLIVPE